MSCKGIFLPNFVGTLSMAIKVYHNTNDTADITGAKSLQAHDQRVHTANLIDCARIVPKWYMFKIWRSRY